MYDRTRKFNKQNIQNTNTLASYNVTSGKMFLLKKKKRLIRLKQKDSYQKVGYQLPQPAALLNLADTSTFPAALKIPQLNVFMLYQHASLSLSHTRTCTWARTAYNNSTLPPTHTKTHTHTHTNKHTHKHTHTHAHFF